MILCGITGGVGMGKSTFAELLRSRGLPVIDTDLIARNLILPGSECLSEILNSFGPAVISEGGSLDRARLGEIVFGDPLQLRRLESILHPRIRRAWKQDVSEWEQRRVRLGFVEIPLLYETDAAGCFNRVVCVACSPSTQRERLRGRGWSAKQSEARISAQWPIQRKMELADCVIWSDVPGRALEWQAAGLLESLEQRCEDTIRPSSGGIV